ncbi:MAG: bifunctional diaminohydroxyphosphoribosylaminopyrimidine deaminase/5-amino-6-(5-phosphoribosylamino)uracil reductase RibD, partial [Saprospiraceae bacterium]
MNEVEKYLNYCVKIAKNGESRVSPNPLVGSIIVHKDQIIAEGWHQYYGSDHAERMALSRVRSQDKSLLSQSQLYVTLEPCNHYGQTPPCTDIIVESGIKEVIFGSYDINPKMQGKSIDYLKSKGINVIGPFPNNMELVNLNKTFETNINDLRPYIILKWAQSYDHFIGNAKARIKISNQYTDSLVHKWRSEVDGILIGRKTIESDHPKLNTRFWTGKNPKKYILSNQFMNTESKIDYDDF